MKPNQKLTTGAKSPSQENKAFAAVQGAWRFYANEKVTLSKLMEPLLALSLDGIERECEEYALVVHDWSSLEYSQHKSKQDKKTLHNRYEQGYELQSSIALSDKTGLPLGIVVQNVTSKEGVYSSYQGDSVMPETSHLEELAQRVKWIESQSVSKKNVHIVDREGDAVEWLRANKTAYWLVRCRQNSTVSYQGQQYQLQALSKVLTFSEQAIEVSYRGKKAYQVVAQADVILNRSAQPKKGKGRKIAGQPLAARYVATKVLDEQGNCLAQWHLLAHVPRTVQAESVALWYYWRWQIECFFKLLKQHGLQVESWQNESALVIAKRLLTASQACVFVWQLQQDNSPQAIETQLFLVRLSGRQMKKHRTITASALFEGLWLFLSAMSLFDSYSPEQLLLFKQRLLI